MSPVAELAPQVTIYELTRDDRDRQRWQKVDVVDAVELGFEPGHETSSAPQTETVLGAWFDATDAFPGIYRAERAGCRALIVHWPGAKAA